LFIAPKLYQRFAGTGSLISMSIGICHAFFATKDGDGFFLTTSAPYHIVRNSILRRGLGMATATVTSKGQITIPLQVRADLGLEAGDRIEFMETEKGQYTIMAATKSVQSLKGIIPKRSKPVSIGDMNAAIVARGAAK
jgi:AbrB family looped-hinge helix DNA binding protein